jgi:hypothetical protein
MNGWRLFAGSTVAILLLFSQYLPAQEVLYGRFYQEIQEIGPRPEGSEGEKRLFAYIQEELEDRSIPYRSLEFDTTRVEHSFSRVLRATLPGARDQRLTVAVPINASVEGLDTNSGDVAMALSLLVTSSQELLPVGLEVVFLGAVPLDTAGPGTRLYLESYYLDPPAAVILLLNASSGESLTVQGATGGIVAPPWLLQRVYSGARSLGIPATVPSTAEQFFEVAFAEADSPLAPFLEAGIPSVALSGSPGIPSSDLPLSHLLPEIVDSFSEGIPGTWDRHYLLFGGAPQGNLAIVGEESYVLLTFAAASFLLFVGVMVRRRVDRYLVTIRRHILIVPLLLATLGLSYLAGSALVSLVTSWRNFPSLVSYRPVLFFGLKAFTAIALFIGVYRVLRGRLLSRNSSFYSAATLLLLTTGVVVMAAINFSLVWYPLWALIFGLVFSLVPSRGLKIIAFLAAPLPFLAALFSALLSQEPRAAAFLLVPDVWGNLLLAVISLPFLLMVIRIDLLLRHPIRGRTNIATEVLAYGSALAAAACLLWASVYIPFSADRPQPVSLLERIDQDQSLHELVVESPAPLGRFRLNYGGQTLMVDTTSRTTTFTLPPPDPVVTLEAEGSAFLTRKRHLLEITAPENPRDLDVRLVSAEPLLVYDAAYPFEMAAENRVAVFDIGASPPMPFNMDLILPGDLSALAEVEVRWDRSFAGVYLVGGPYEVSFRTVASSSILLTRGAGES